MELFRKGIDNSYNLLKSLIYSLTQENPEIAHDKFVETSIKLNSIGLDKILLDSKLNLIDLPFELSNAAGFNKNGDIPPQFLQYLGFNRVVVGTVTNDEWNGNLKPRTMRFPQTKSLINWMGLPGIGAKRVAENLESFGRSPIPVTINLMGTPGKSGDELLLDLESTMRYTAPYTTRFELNISCPNTHSSGTCKMDARSEYQSQLSGMLDVLTREAYGRELYLKVSPDLDLDGVKEILNVITDYNIDGITSTNTTTTHLPSLIPNSPGKGGASGRAVRDASRVVQDHFINEISKKGLNSKLIACGGIDSPDEVKVRLNKGATGIQIYTPLIFEGSKLLTDIRKHYI